MSILSMINPFASPQTNPPNPSGEGSGTGATPTDPAPKDAVQPSQQGGSSTGSGSSTSYSGSGAGSGGAASQQPTRSSSFLRRPPNAAPVSIVNAQTAERTKEDDSPLSLDRARRAAIGLMEKQRYSDLIEGLKQTPDTLKVDITAAKKEMPDPLPTSPFLKRADA